MNEILLWASAKVWQTFFRAKSMTLIEKSEDPVTIYLWSLDISTQSIMPLNWLNRYIYMLHLLVWRPSRYITSSRLSNLNTLRDLSLDPEMMQRPSSDKAIDEMWPESLLMCNFMSWVTFVSVLDYTDLLILSNIENSDAFIPWTGDNILVVFSDRSCSDKVYMMLLAHWTESVSYFHEHLWNDEFHSEYAVHKFELSCPLHH